CRITIELRDNFGPIKLDLYGEDIEQLIPFTAREVRDQDMNCEAIEEALTKSNNICFVKKSQNSYETLAPDHYAAIIGHRANVDHANVEETDVQNAMKSTKYKTNRIINCVSFC
ncbi:hypothetical protein ACH5RR_009974, partial [Cinchona calisaya]